MKGRIKRAVKTYKIEDEVYKKALARGRETKTPLATLIEEMVTGFAEGKNIYLSDRQLGHKKIN